MGKLIFPHASAEYHFQFGVHVLKPRSKERIDSNKFDALVLEENLHKTAQGNRITAEMANRRKPVYLVENPGLLTEMHLREVDFAAMKQGGITAYGYYLVKCAVEKIRRKISPREIISQEPISRRSFLGKFGPGILWLIGTAGSGEFGKSIPTDIGAMTTTQNKELSVSEVDALPNDVKSSLKIAKRNAVIAHGLLQLAEKLERKLGRKPVIGVAVGAGHYNIIDYLRNEELRKKVMGEYLPKIRRL